MSHSVFSWKWPFSKFARYSESFKKKNILLWTIEKYREKITIKERGEKLKGKKKINALPLFANTVLQWLVWTSTWHFRVRPEHYWRQALTYTNIIRVWAAIAAIRWNSEIRHRPSRVWWHFPLILEGLYHDWSHRSQIFN